MRRQSFSTTLCWLLIILAPFGLCSCATKGKTADTIEPVRRVDTRKAPEMKSLGERAREVGDEMYPKVCALLKDGDTEFPSQFDITFAKGLANGNAGETRFTHVFLDANSINRLPSDSNAFDQLLIHELAHVAQTYHRPLLGHWLVSTTRPPRYWEEGMADYVCFKLGATNGWDCPQCGLFFSDYRQGYSCAGAFLLYLDNTYNSNIVRHLNTALRREHFSEDFFAKETGKTLPELWRDFQNSTAFTPNAQRMSRLKEELGYINGQPPKDLEKRFTRYLDQNADADTKQLMTRAHFAHTFVSQCECRMAFYLYAAQPGKSAEGFMVALQRDGHLPGFIKGEHGSLNGFMKVTAMDLEFPITRTFEVKKKGDTATYHYIAYRAALDTDWKLQRAWRTEGGKNEELSIPENLAGR